MNIDNKVSHAEFLLDNGVRILFIRNKGYLVEFTNPIVNIRNIITKDFIVRSSSFEIGKYGMNKLKKEDYFENFESLLFYSDYSLNDFIKISKLSIGYNPKEFVEISKNNYISRDRFISEMKMKGIENVEKEFFDGLYLKTALTK